MVIIITDIRMFLKVRILGICRFAVPIRAVLSPFVHFRAKSSTFVYIPQIKWTYAEHLVIPIADRLVSM
jgi:hypothetical protein